MFSEVDPSEPGPRTASEDVTLGRLTSSAHEKSSACWGDGFVYVLYMFCIFMTYAYTYACTQTHTYVYACICIHRHTHIHTHIIGYEDNITTSPYMLIIRTLGFCGIWTLDIQVV